MCWGVGAYVILELSVNQPFHHTPNQNSTPRYTLAPSPVLPTAAGQHPSAAGAGIHNSGSSTASSLRSSSPMSGGPVALEGQSRPPRHRVPYAPVGGSKLRESASEERRGPGLLGQTQGTPLGEEDEDEEEEELRRVAERPSSE